METRGGAHLVQSGGRPSNPRTWIVRREKKGRERQGNFRKEDDEGGGYPQGDKEGKERFWSGQPTIWAVLYRNVGGKGDLNFSQRRGA